MRWQLEWGKHERHLVKQQEAGQQVAALDNAEELEEWNICYWKAFCELAPSRNISEAGVSGILVSEITAWLDVRGLTEQESRRDYLYYIQQLDNEFLKYTSEQMKQQQKKNQSKIDQAKRKR